jgi:hypothetical protein
VIGRFLDQAISGCKIASMRLLALCTFAILGGACAPRALVSRAPARSEVRGPVAPGQADAVFGRAIEVLGERGYQFTECDDELSLLRTERAEQDAPCYGMTCLVRQKVVLKVGWRSLSLVVRREVFDSAVRSWVEAYDQASQLDVEREEREILREMASADLEALSRDRLVAYGAGRQDLASCDRGRPGDREERPGEAAGGGSGGLGGEGAPTADRSTPIADLGMMALQPGP